MNQDKYVFTQITDFLNRSKFNRIVAKYNGDRYVKSYSYWNQLLTLIFWSDRSLLQFARLRYSTSSPLR